ncbi:MAG TPA: hypothetical protein DCS07_08875 [Bdellovibrionales bacterium]|nr:MAG: hypothetical protein A2Z97_11550 [Bdellovibrionales bacterium GWB1_52_6]OFZ03904.1 MAG: hypothetical protein A2X97_16035 [Bdellovibrionales bacterium GWA1_52_35]OFZ37398.1 MAG: hypothetical protein A2070_12140 [Bdellovibrionales bacterium GWC1_52_8]HAR42723.1 hypothetical protein [Bdellovibrionales bacterium]HCM39657.1 hypothetical protein [Bdellovibrionales bacterium]
MKLFPWALFRRLVLVQWLLVLTTVCAAGLGARTLFKDTITAQSQKQQEDTLAALANYWTPEPSWCGRAAKGTRLRLTLIDSQGFVICDSEGDPSIMDNHLSRPEIVAAGENGTGHALRQSNTLRDEMLYSALRVIPPGSTQEVPGAWYLRSSLHIAELGAMLRIFDRSLVFFLAITAFVLALIALFSARTLILPLSEILRKFRQEGVHSGDWNELENSINSMSQELNSRVEELLTERAQQSTVLGAISDGILAVDRAGLPLFFNSRFELYFGTKRNLRGLEFWELFRAPDIIEAFRNAMEKTESTNLNFASESEPEGKRHFSVSIAPLRRSSGATYGAVGVFHDITEIKQAEQLRIDFVANVSHELRTPLTAIKGYTDTLLSDLQAGRPPEKEFLDVISRNSERLMALIQDLLDISSLESSAVLQRVNVPIGPLSQRILETLQSVLKSREQECTLRVNANTVFADPGRIEQVIVNLLDNASKYSGHGTKIRLEWQPESLAGIQGVLLKVQDSGPGIPAEHIPRLFERFYRIDKARSRDQGGTGLGLAIVKHIVLRHGGKVWVESTPGKGTIFFCYFPEPK